MPFEVGNLYGRSGHDIIGVLRKAAAAQDYSKLRRGVEACLTKAANGSLPHLQFVFDRLAGKPAQSVTVTSNDDARTLSIQDIALMIMQSRKADATDALPQSNPVVNPADR